MGMRLIYRSVELMTMDLAGAIIRRGNETLCIDVVSDYNCSHRLYTHNHPNHVPSTINGTYYSPFGGNTVKPGDELTVGSFSVRVVNAYNITKLRNGVPIHPRGFGVGYLISVDGITIYHMGDTDLIEDLTQLRNVKVDILLIPIGGGTVMTPEEAADAVMLLRPKIAIPIHFSDRRQFVKFRDIAQPYTQIILMRELTSK